MVIVVPISLVTPVPIAQDQVHIPSCTIFVFVLKASDVWSHSTPRLNRSCSWKNKYFDAFRVVANHLCEPDSSAVYYLHPVSNPLVKEAVCLLEANELNSGAGELRDFTKGVRAGDLTAEHSQQTDPGSFQFGLNRRFNGPIQRLY
jgi:hypothetical protein